MRYGADIYALRIGNVSSRRIRPVRGLPRQPDDAQAQRLELYRRARPRRDRASVLEKDGLGFQVFNAVNDTITARVADKRVPRAILSGASR